MGDGADRRDEGTGGIRLETVSKTYEGIDALDAVDLRVAPGDVHALVGPNGSGKSTLLAVVLGLERPSSGAVRRPDERVGCSFQAPNVYPDLTVDENLAVFAAMGDAGEEWVGTVRSDLGLDGVRSRVAADLSGGYRCLLDVALAFVRRPRFVVLDEPLDELDGAARERVVAFVADYAGDERTVLVSTHHVDAFGPAVDRVTVLADGRVTADRRVEGRTDPLSLDPDPTE